MKKQNLINTAICLVIILLISLACSSFTQGKAAGEKAVEIFHAQMNEEKFDEIYNQASKEFQTSDNKEAIIKFLQTVHKKLGVIGKSTSQGWHVNTTPAGTVVNLTYQTEFAQDTATESFIFFMNGEEAKLTGYNVNSKKLISE